MEFLLGLSLIANIFVVIFCITLIKDERKDRQDLLNRLMANDYKEYAVFEARKGVADYEREAKKILSKEQDVFPVD